MKKLFFWLNSLIGNLAMLGTLTFGEKADKIEAAVKEHYVGDVVVSHAYELLNGNMAVLASSVKTDCAGGHFVHLCVQDKKELKTCRLGDLYDKYSNEENKEEMNLLIKAKVEEMVPMELSQRYLDWAVEEEDASRTSRYMELSEKYEDLANAMVEHEDFADAVKE